MKKGETIMFEKTEKIISDYKNGLSSKVIKKKYGDFGKFILTTYLTQPIFITQVFLSWNEKKMKYDIDLLKKEIIKSFVDGASIGSIQKKYGEYGVVCINNFKKFYKELIPKY